MSKRESVPRARIGTANREHAARVYVTKEHERERYGMHSPSPHQYSPSLKGVRGAWPRPHLPHLRA